MTTFQSNDDSATQSKTDRLFAELHRVEKQIHIKTDLQMPKRPPAPKTILEAISLIGLSSLMD